MKTLVAFYSRTGTTKKVGQDIAKALKCDKEAIVDTVNRMGPIGYIRSGRDSMKRNLTKLKKTKKDPAKYGLVIVGTPIWAWNVSTPVRTYLTENRGKFKKIAFFCTQGGSGSERAFKEMQDIAKKKPLRTLVLTTKQVVEGNYAEQIKKFTAKLKTSRTKKKKSRA